MIYAFVRAIENMSNMSKRRKRCYFYIFSSLSIAMYCLVAFAGCDGLLRIFRSSGTTAVLMVLFFAIGIAIFLTIALCFFCLVHMDGENAKNFPSDIHFFLLAAVLLIVMINQNIMNLILR
jgi:hypothetical protein